jgi:hypothetical protein
MYTSSREWNTEKYTVRYFPYLFSYQDIDHVTFSQICSWAWNFLIFCFGLYIINRTLHGGLKIWLLSSRVKNNILLAALFRKILFSPLEDKSHIFAPPCNILYCIIVSCWPFRFCHDIVRSICDQRHREEIYQRGNTRQIVSRRCIQSIYYRKLY